MQEKRLTHLTELDGLRGLAVVAVMCYHFVHLPEVSNNKWDLKFNNILLSGWIGVDLFFVLSGFLITRILLSSKIKTGYFSSFYIKRFLRIFPLYYLYLLLCFCIILPYSHTHLTGTEQVKVTVAQHSEIWFWLYLSNIKQMINGVFFGAGMGHLWSLAIEEQFYIIWPLVIYFFSSRVIKSVSISIFFGAMLLRISLALYNVDPQLIYVFTLTRIDALALGTLVATLAMDNYDFSYGRIRFTLAISAILSVLLLYFFGPRAEHHPVMYTIGLSVFGVCFALTLILLQSKFPFPGRFLFTNRALVFFGKYSYALYIFHPLVRQVLLKFFGYPRVVFGSQVPWEMMFIIIGIGISLLVALLSWHLYEKWFLKLKTRIPLSKVKLPDPIKTVL